MNWRSQWQLVVSRLFDMSTLAENTCSGALFSSERGVPFCPILYNRREGRQCFAVIDDRRSTIESDHSRERRFQSWITTSSLQRLHQRALFSADICASPSMQNHIERKVAAEYILANIACGICFFNGPFNLSARQGQFASYINKGCRNTAGIASNNYSLKQLMRVLLHNHAIFKSTRFAFISIAAKVARLIIFGEKAPLHPGRETCSTTPTQTRFLDKINQCIGLVFFKCLGKRFI